MKKILALLTMSVILVLQAQAQRPWKHETFETDTPMVHDPVMAFEDGTYHIYATGMGIQHLTSKDRRTWTVHREPVMSVIPKWTRDSVAGFTHHVWAPDVIKWHGRWWLAYSCSTFGKNGSAIGLLSSPSLSFPLWTDEGCIVTSREKRDDWNAIDPCFIIDDDDKPWLVWGSFWDGIQLCRLDSTMHLAPGQQPRTIARRHPVGCTTAEPNPTSKFAGTNAIEAPFVMKHDGWYYLFAAWDYCCRGAKSNYKVVVGRSRTVDGPYVDDKGVKMTDGGGLLVIEGDGKVFEAAGHCAAYSINGEDLFICHGYYLPHQGASILIQRRIEWHDGWPRLVKERTNQ